jgi:hypothetical protein
MGSRHKRHKRHTGCAANAVCLRPSLGREFSEFVPHKKILRSGVGVAA